MSQIRHQAASWLLWGGIAIALILAFSHLLFKRLVLDRMARIEAVLARFPSDEGGLSLRLPIDHRDEIGAVARAFNHMADQLQALMHQRDRLLNQYAAQSERIVSVFHAITDRLLLLAPDYSVLMANSAALGESPESSTERKCYEVMFGSHEPCRGCCLPVTLEEKAPASSEICTPGGETYLSNCYPILDATSGEVKSVVHYCRSITEQKTMEAHMRRAERLASIGEMVAGVAHELNNPLGTIMFYTDLIKAELGPGSPLVADVEVVEKQTEICKSVVGDLLTFSRNVETRMFPADVNATIDKVLAMVGKQFEKEGVVIACRFDPDIPPIPLDQARIQQVWMNLLINAKQAIPHGQGQITVSTQHCAQRGRVEVTVSDTGEGIAADIVNRIFDPFFTTKDTGEGTGLGLSVSYGIVQEHGGDIRVSSVSGRGTTFQVILPDGNGVTGHGR
jgi:nitrogen-specific signal transduction histidine kinase/HAMP domain-containing protein